MFLKKKWFTILFAIITIVILTACGSNGENEDVVSQDAGIVQESSNDFMTLSDGLEKYPVWFETSADDVTRTSSLRHVFIFENGEASVYKRVGDKVTPEDINGLTDDEVINFFENSDSHEFEHLGKYNFTLKADGSGNETSYQSVKFENNGSYNFQFDVGNLIYQEIYDTIFAGFYESDVGSDNAFITRVDESFDGFDLDSPDTDKDIIDVK